MVGSKHGKCFPTYRPLSMCLHEDLHILIKKMKCKTLADPWGGHTLCAPHPLTASDLYFMPKTLSFLNFLALLAIHFKHRFKRNMPKTR